MDETLKEINVQLPYLEMGSGFLIGLSVGFFLKKSFKVMLVLMGLIVVALFVLESKGVIVINEENLGHTVTAGVDAFKAFGVFLQERLGHVTIAGGGSAVAGFFTGLKWG